MTAMLAVGNDMANSIWEHTVDAEWVTKRPSSTASRAQKEAWIRAKYVDRRFLQTGMGDVQGMLPCVALAHPCHMPPAAHPACNPHSVYFRRLYQAARNQDVFALMWALAHSADPDWRNPTQRGYAALCVQQTWMALIGRGVNRRTAMHAACAAGSVACVELLLQAGANPGALDDDGNTPIRCVPRGHALHVRNVSPAQPAEVER